MLESYIESTLPLISPVLSSTRRYQMLCILCQSPD